MKLVIELNSLPERSFSEISIGRAFIFARHKGMADPYVQIKTAETQYCLLEKFLDDSASKLDASGYMDVRCTPFEPRSPKITKP